MICLGCNSPAHRIVQIDGYESCESCGGFSAAGGVSTDGLLTRNSLRVRAEAVKYEGDTIPPHTYDKSRRKAVPNKEFIKRFPERAGEFFTPAEIKAEGLHKLANKAKSTAIRKHRSPRKTN